MRKHCDAPPGRGPVPDRLTTNKESRDWRLQSSGLKRYKLTAPAAVEMPNCPQCGEEIGSGDAPGLCPSCLLQGALYTSVGADDETRTQPIGPAGAGPGDND